MNITLYGKRFFAAVIKLRSLRWGDFYTYSLPFSGLLFHFMDSVLWAQKFVTLMKPNLFVFLLFLVLSMSYLRNQWPNLRSQRFVLRFSSMNFIVLVLILGSLMILN